MNTDSEPINITIEDAAGLSAEAWQLIAKLVVDVSSQVTHRAIERLVQPLAEGVRQAVLDGLHVEHSMVVRDEIGVITGAIKTRTH